MKGFFRSAFVQGLAAALITAAVAACGPEEERPADGILSHEQMVALLQDMYIAEEKVNHLTLPRDSAERVFQLMEVRVFENAGVTDSAFRVSMDYYISHPKQLEKIYTAIIDSLTLKEQKALPGLFRP